MNNIFENSKFGDRFKCRDNTDAIFIEIVHNETFNDDFAKLIDSVTCKLQYYRLNGMKDPTRENWCDIMPN